MEALLKLLLALSLPALTYWSTIHMPFGEVNAITTLNNFGWMASALYFIGYLPLKGLGFKHWIPRIFAALLAVSLFVTGWQVAARYRKAQWELVRQGEHADSQTPGSPAAKQGPVTQTQAYDLVRQQPDVKTLEQKLGPKLNLVLTQETGTHYIIAVGENQKTALTYRVNKGDGTVVKQ
jgi:hypothetical protein